MKNAHLSQAARTIGTTGKRGTRTRAEKSLLESLGTYLPRSKRGRTIFSEKTIKKKGQIEGRPKIEKRDGGRRKPSQRKGLDEQEDNYRV